MLSKEKHEKYALTEMLKVRGLKKKIFQENRNPKRNRIADFNIRILLKYY